MSKDDDEMLVVGRILGAYGVHGWVRVFSETSPQDNILRYQPWYIERPRAAGTARWQATRMLEGRRQGKGLVAKIDGCDDRDRAMELRGTAVAISTAQLPALEQGDYYWRDLIGLAVVNRKSVSLGTVTNLIETGNNDVLVVSGERERLIPYLPDRVVVEVDLESGRMLVDWDEDF